MDAKIIVPCAQIELLKNKQTPQHLHILYAVRLLKTLSWSLINCKHDTLKQALWLCIRNEIYVEEYLIS